MAITAVKEEADLYRMDQFPLWFHLPPTLKNFRILFAQTNFGTLLVNTLLLSICVVLITVVTAVPAGYVLTRLRLKGAETIGIAIFLTYLVPPIVLFLPLARVVGMLGLWDSWWALVVVYPTFTIPFCTWLIMGFFKTLPREIEEAAWVDGCGVVGGITRVVLPLSRPGIMITTIFAFTFDAGGSLRGRLCRRPGSENGDGRPHGAADPRRHLLLGLLDGRRPYGRPAHRHPVHALHRPLHPGPHRDRRPVKGVRSCNTTLGILGAYLSTYILR